MSTNTTRAKNLVKMVPETRDLEKDIQKLDLQNHIMYQIPERK